MTELSKAPSEQLSGYEGRFQDSRLDEMLFRYRCRNYPRDMSPEDADRWRAYCHERWDNTRDCASVLKELAALRDESGRSGEALDDLARYVKALTAPEQG